MHRPRQLTLTRVQRRYRCLAIGFGALTMLIGVAPATAHEADGNPARIHSGSCERLGAVVFPLNGVSASVDINDAPVATPVAVNADSAYQVAVSETTIEAPLDALLGGEHALMIYESDEDMTGIACGNIGGAMMGGVLVTGLGEIEVPGHSGIALFQPDGDRTVVTILMGHDLAPVSAAGAGASLHDEGSESTEAEATPAA